MTSAPFRLRHDERLLELTVRRDGLRTVVGVDRDGERATGAVGVGVVVAELDPAASVLVATVLPGVVARAFLLVGAPGEDGHRLPFDPPVGSLAARLRALQERHPRLWAARHVVLAAGKVLLGVLGVTLLLKALLGRVLAWLADHLPHLDLPSIPWPSIPWPDIPWPAIPWPEVHLPGWVGAVLNTLKYWVPIVIAVGVAVREVRRRRRPTDVGRRDRTPAGRHDAHR